jgi:hypothetical protein
MRTPIVLLTCSTLVACSTQESLPPIQPYVLPSMPTTAALVAGVKQAAAEAHLIAPLEMSDLRPTDHGPGHFMLCMRGVSNDYRTGFYTVFFDDKYKGSRLPVIFENCETQNYRPVP